MKQSYFLYSAIFLLILINLFCFYQLIKQKSEVKPLSQINNSIESFKIEDEYMHDMLSNAYSYLQLNGLVIDTLNGVLYDKNKIINADTKSLLKDDNIVLFVSELSCATCVTEQIYYLTKFDKIYRRENRRNSIIIMTNHLREDVKEYISMINSDLPILDLNGSIVKLPVLTNDNSALIALLHVNNGKIINSFVFDAESKCYSHYFYDMLCRYFDK